MMQFAGAEARCRDVLIIAALVVVISGVKRLVHVADEVQEELESHDPLLRICPGIGKLRHELLDLIDHASFCRTSGSRYVGRRKPGMHEARLIEVGAVDLDVDKMPLPRSEVAVGLGTVAASVAIPIGPDRSADHVRWR